MVTLPRDGKVPEPARTWDHYKAYEDLGVANNIEFHNKAERVFAELWVIIKFPSHTAVAKLSRKLRFNIPVATLLYCINLQISNLNKNL